MRRKKQILSEEQLIAAIKSKSEAGAAALYDMYAKTLYHSIFKIFNDKETAEDVCQDALIRIWESFDSYDASKGKLYTWMKCVSRNLALTTLNGNSFLKYKTTLPVNLEIEQLEDKISGRFNPDRLDIKNMVSLLRPNQQIIIDMIYYKGYSYAEVADELGLPMGTVKTRRQAGVTVLKNIYAEADHSIFYG